MTTIYEFVVETLAPDGDDLDILDTMAFDNLSDAAQYGARCHERHRYALRRDSGNPVSGLTARYYAYPDADGKLPLAMETCDGAEDGPVIPKQYRKLTFPEGQP